MSCVSPYAYESTDLNLRICILFYESRKVKLLNFFEILFSISFSHFLMTLSAVVSRDTSDR